ADCPQTQTATADCSHTPAAAAARIASSTPNTIVALGPGSDPPPYAYSTLTSASAISFMIGPSGPGVLGTVVTSTSRSAAWWWWSRSTAAPGTWLSTVMRSGPPASRAGA